jgi:hypothetical protein
MRECPRKADQSSIVDKQANERTTALHRRQINVKKFGDSLLI